MSFQNKNELAKTDIRWRNVEEESLLGGRVLELALLASHLLSNDAHAIEPTMLRADVIQLADTLLDAMSPDLLFVFEAGTEGSKAVKNDVNADNSIKNVRPILIRSRIPTHLPEDKLHDILERQNLDVQNGTERPQRQRSFMKKVATPDLWEDDTSVGVVDRFGDLRFTFAFHKVGPYLFALGTEITALEEEWQHKNALAEKILASAKQAGEQIERQGRALKETKEFLSTLEMLLAAAVRADMSLPESVYAAKSQVEKFSDRLYELLHNPEE